MRPGNGRWFGLIPFHSSLLSAGYRSDPALFDGGRRGGATVGVVTVMVMIVIVTIAFTSSDEDARGRGQTENEEGFEWFHRTRSNGV